MHMVSESEEISLEGISLEQARIQQELSYLFGEDIVSQARLIDVVDLNLNDKMTRCISKGVTELKKMKDQSSSQKEFIGRMSAGERLVLCMWIMEMDLLEKMQSRSYLHC
jgi:hypothetical protein